MRYLVIFASLLITAQAEATLADDFTNERREQFVDILSKHDCRFHNQNPSPALIQDMTAAGYERAEIRAIGKDLIETGDGVIEGGALVAKIGPCAG